MVMYNYGKHLALKYSIFDVNDWYVRQCSIAAHSAKHVQWVCVL